MSYSQIYDTSKGVFSVPVKANQLDPLVTIPQSQVQNLVQDLTNINNELASSGGTNFLVNWVNPFVGGFPPLTNGQSAVLTIDFDNTPGANFLSNLILNGDPSNPNSVVLFRCNINLQLQNYTTVDGQVNYNINNTPFIPNQVFYINRTPGVTWSGPINLGGMLEIPISVNSLHTGVSADVQVVLQNNLTSGDLLICGFSNIVNCTYYPNGILA